MNYLDWLATLAYPAWSALCLVWAAILVAEYRAWNNPSLLLLCAAAIGQSVAFALLSVSTGMVALVPFVDVSVYVRSLAVASATCAWIFTLLYLWRRWNETRTNRSERDTDNL